MHREVERTSGIVLDRTPTSDSRRYLLGPSTPLNRAEVRLVDTIRELKTKINRLDDYYRRIVQRELVTAIYTALGYDNSVPRNRFYQDLIKDPTLAREVFGNRTGLDANNLPAILSTLDPRDKNGPIHTGNDYVHRHTIADARAYIDNDGMKFLLEFLDGGNPWEELESAAYRVQAELSVLHPSICPPTQESSRQGDDSLESSSIEDKLQKLVADAENRFAANTDARVTATVQTLLDARIQAEVDVLDARIQAVDSRVNAGVDARIQAEVDVLDARIQAVDSRVNAGVDAQVDARMRAWFSTTHAGS
jgi:hypothetical protein